MNSFFAMGGYAAYVWPSYLLSAAVLAFAVWVSLAARARARSAVTALEADAVPPARK